MKKKLALGLVGLFASTTVYFLINLKRLDLLHDLKQSVQLKTSKSFPIEPAGNPLTDTLENADMVSEGSQYGVEYYNKHKSLRHKSK
ncbi:hypothetical protein [Amphibacillus sediminis]|uniref:hypothetical protein n=1 Tax=Amphibacillus sediminis TaxID=360185 RepID=UPI000835A080|nr:hypothetical protein [Amphibacillus sediminis]